MTTRWYRGNTADVRMRIREMPVTISAQSWTSWPTFLMGFLSHPGPDSTANRPRSVPSKFFSFRHSSFIHRTSGRCLVRTDCATNLTTEEKTFHMKPLLTLWALSNYRPVSGRYLTLKSRVQSQATPGGICGTHSSRGTGFGYRIAVLVCQCHSTYPFGAGIIF